MAHKDYFNFTINFETSTEKQAANEYIAAVCDYYESDGIQHDSTVRDIVFNPSIGPKFIPKTDINQLGRDQILISIQSIASWDEFIYEFSHEITHCYIHVHNNIFCQHVNWIEEPICEMMSFVIIEYIKNDLTSTLPLLSQKIGQDSAIKKISKFEDREKNRYLSWEKEDILYAANRDMLSSINENAMKIDHRKEHSRVVNQMLDLYKKELLPGLIVYKDYIRSGTILLDTETYRKDYPNNDLVRLICNLQEDILHR